MERVGGTGSRRVGGTGTGSRREWGTQAQGYGKGGGTGSPRDWGAQAQGHGEGGGHRVTERVGGTGIASRRGWGAQAEGHREGGRHKITKEAKECKKQNSLDFLTMRNSKYPPRTATRFLVWERLAHS